MVAFIDEHRATYGVESICRVLPIAPATYDGQLAQRRDPARRSARARRDAELRVAIQRVFDAHFQVYGPRKVWHQLQREGVRVARCVLTWYWTPWSKRCTTAAASGWSAWCITVTAGPNTSRCGTQTVWRRAGSPRPWAARGTRTTTPSPGVEPQQDAVDTPGEGRLAQRVSAGIRTNHMGQPTKPENLTAGLVFVEVLVLDTGPRVLDELLGREHCQTWRGRSPGLAVGGKPAHHPGRGVHQETLAGPVLGARRSGNDIVNGANDRLDRLDVLFVCHSRPPWMRMELVGTVSRPAVTSGSGGGGGRVTRETYMTRTE